MAAQDPVEVVTDDRASGLTPVFAWLDGLDYALLLRLGLLLLALPILILAARWFGRVVTRRFTAQAGMLTGKAIAYTGMVIITIMVMRELGFEIGPVLGALGVVGVAVGFASQSSLSNIISGMFLLGERPFAVGDVIKVDDVTGEVLAIDLLSVKLRTFENQFVRIPNETVIKTRVTNITRFPIRRIDIDVSVAYKEDVAKVRELLADIADVEPLCLDEPKPIILFKSFGDSGLIFMFGVWCARADFLDCRNAIMDAIKQRFDDAGIEIPFPHMSLYAGSATGALPVRVVSGE